MTNVANKTAQALLVYEEDRRPHHPPNDSYRKWSVSEDILKYWRHKHERSLLSSHEGLKVRMLEGSHHLHGRDFVKRHNETSNDTTVVMDETKLIPLEHPGAACGSKPDLTLDLTFGVNLTSGNWTINGIPYQSPNIPTLLKILTDKDGVTDSDFTQSEHTVLLPGEKCIEFNITGNSGLEILHPIHIHGHNFDVVQFGNNPPNYVDPPRRDTVGSLDSGVRIQFKTDNPGPWFMHCHIDWHLHDGFAMVFAEAPEDIKNGPKSVPVDKQWRELCMKYEQFPPGFL
ncbi:unnamed protein product [Rhizoctonia solani]|uniref:Plastocyanin-like domain-containing protein n=1 Tax=Rhizoctonia solani TaxID=456999 RepID=A0A8H2Y113_9AGAM|nr:unnamed protein product [Rhizoctonia solani]